MGELYRPPQFHSQNREYFGVFGAVNFIQVVDSNAVTRIEKCAFRDIESDSCGPASPRALTRRFPVCASRGISSAREEKDDAAAARAPSWGIPEPGRYSTFILLKKRLVFMPDRRQRPARKGDNERVKTQRFVLDPADLENPAAERALESAARILRGGGLVALPTETVYGLGRMRWTGRR